MDTTLALIFRVEVVNGQAETNALWLLCGVQTRSVRRVVEGQAAGVSLAPQLDVQPDLLRTWVRLTNARAGTPPYDVLPRQSRQPCDQEELRRLQRENTAPA